MPQALKGHEWVGGWQAGSGLLQLSPAAHWHHLLVFEGGCGSEGDNVKVTARFENGGNQSPG